MPSDELKLDELFLAALDLTAEERERFLHEQCGENHVLKERVKRLLAAQSQVGSFLDRPAVVEQDPDQTQEYGAAVDQPETQIGPYKILQQIGEGGMGIVYMAEQTQPVRRRVALKIIKPGMDSREVIARFEAERQALALMDHPNIAKVLDAGTTDAGRPFFVMEFVNGLPLTEYCDQHQLEPYERIALFISVCRGVQHAHQKGVIHRDLKPSNILVAEYDHDPIPKVIDFGVAKATNQQLTEKTLFTQFGQIVGTIEYMSPEQAKRNQLDVDTRSDVYSLGIVLHELLVGQTPLDSKKMRAAAFDEMLRMIREEDPQLPSVKLSSSHEIASIAACRGVEPNRLPSMIRGDLDWIILKTLQKDRSHRYGGIAEFVEDLERHLNNLPINAGPPRLAARLKKFVRRNALATGFATAGVLVVGIVLFWAWRNAELASSELAERSQRVSVAIDEASLALGVAIKSPVKNEGEWKAAAASLQRVEDLLAEGDVSTDVRDRFEAFKQTAKSASVEHEIAVRLENVLITCASHPDLESWRRMERELRQIFTENGFDLQGTDPMAIASQISEHQFKDRFVDLLEMWLGTIGQIGSMGGEPATPESMQPWAQAMYAVDKDPLRTGIRKFIYEGSGVDKDKLRALVQRADLEQYSARTLSWLAVVYNMAQLHEEADQTYEFAMQRYPADAMLNFDYGLVLTNQKRTQEAIRMFARASALRPDVAGVWQVMGIELEKVNEFDNAIKAFERACELESDYGPTWIHLGEVCLKQDVLDKAVEAALKATSLSPSNPAAFGLLGRAQMRRGNFRDALAALETCVELAREDKDWDAPADEWLEECKKLLAAANQEN